MNNSTSIKYLISSILPDHISAKYPKLVDFAVAFFEYLDKENKSSYYQNTLYHQRDIRNQEEEFLGLIQRELGLLSKKSLAADPKVFYDHLSQLWAAKGSEESIKTFFRLFLDDEITVYYPWESVLIPSDGRWRIDQILRVSMISGDPNDFTGKTVRQIGGDGVATVSKVEKSIYRDGTVYDLYLLKPTIVPKFIDQGKIFAVEDENLVAEVYRSVTDLEIIDGGKNYSVGDKVEIRGYEGLSFIAYVSAVNEDGAILNIDIIDFGSGNTPSHILNSDNPPTFYYRDFLVYANTDSIIDELELNGINNFFINVREEYLTTYRFTEPLGLLDGAVGSLNHEYVDTKDLYFAEDYNGTSAFNNQGSVGGGITQEVYSGVLGELTPPIFVESQTGSGAQLNIVYGSIPSYGGYYEGVKGQLSESIVLQDSKFYQKFSYEVKTRYSADQWIEPLKKTVHPVGVEVIGNIAAFNEEFVGINNSQIITRIKEPANYTILENPGIADTVLGVQQDYVYNNNTDMSIGTDIYFAEDYVGVAVFDNTNSVSPSNSDTLVETITTTEV